MADDEDTPTIKIVEEKISKPQNKVKNISESCQKLNQRLQAVTDQIKKVADAKPNPILQKAAEDKTQIELCLNRSEEELNELITFGNALIENIKVSSCQRELARRVDEENEIKKIRKTYQEKSIETMAYFDVIRSKWSELKLLKEPMNLFEQLEKQKKRLEEYIQSQNAIIKQCQDVVDRLNEKYFENLDKQAFDIISLVERIDYQIELMKDSYNKQLELLEATAEEQQKIAYDAAQSKFRSFLQLFDGNEQKKVDLRKERDTMFARQIQKICLEQDEITVQTQIKLDRDAELLQLELRNTKNNMFMNSEKLDYNYRVLQTRNEETGFVNNEQKRRLTKMYETIATLKKKIATTKNTNNQTIQKLEGEICKLNDSIDELIKKTDFYRITNQNKLNAVWDINFKDVKTKIHRIVKIDKLLYEQQLGVEWVAPNIQFENEKSIRHLFHNPSAAAASSSSSDEDKTTTTTTSNENSNQIQNEGILLKNILKQITNRVGFMIERTILKMIEPFTDKEKDIVCIDSIFNALKITKTEEIAELIKYFLPYSWCPNCKIGLTKNSTNEMRDLESVDATTTAETAETIGNADGGKNLKKQQQSTQQCLNHKLIIKPAFVLNVLRNLIERNNQIAMNEEKKHQKTGRDDFSRTPASFDPIAEKEKVRSFWAKFGSVMPDDKIAIWKSIEHGLKHYLDSLKRREALDLECELLRNQNFELKHLLKKHDS